MKVVRRLATPPRVAKICSFTLAALTLAAACGNPESEPGPGSGGSASTSTGGTGPSGGSALGGALTTSGGTFGTGGTVSNTGGIVSTTGGASSGGVSATGGASTGGTGNAAGTSGSGGASAMGGASGSGGTPSSGGVAATGGSPSTGGGGGAATGGAKATGGTPSTGGSGGSDGVYRPCPSSGTPCKIMPFGDSITDGYGTAGGYRVELFRLAHQAGKNITFVGTGSNSPGMVDGVTFPPNHEGHSGFTIDATPSRSGIAPLVATVMPQFTPHIVLLMIGTNDCIDSYQLASAPTRLGSLIDSIFTRLPNILMVVAQPIPSQEDPLNTRIQTYNAAIPAVVKARADAGKHILLVDMYAPFTAVSSYKTTLLKDTWHPNEAGHAILGARWYSVLAASL